jgi:probable addiction module antidote protein
MDELTTLPWRTEDHLTTAEDIAAYLEAAVEDGDPELITYALGVIDRSTGVAAWQTTKTASC